MQQSCGAYTLNPIGRKFRPGALMTSGAGLPRTIPPPHLGPTFQGRSKAAQAGSSSSSSLEPSCIRFQTDRTIISLYRSSSIVKCRVRLRRPLLSRRRSWSAAAICICLPYPGMDDDVPARALPGGRSGSARLPSPV